MASDSVRLAEALDALLDRIQWDLRDKGHEPQSSTWRGAILEARDALTDVSDSAGHFDGFMHR